MRKKFKSSAWEKAKRYGVDMSLIEMNLKRTPTERIVALQNAVSFTKALAASGVEYYARIRKAHKTAVR